MATSIPTSDIVLFQDEWKISDPKLYDYLKNNETKCRHADYKVIPCGY